MDEIHLIPSMDEIHLINDMEKDKLDIKWDEKAVQNFENYLKLMYGEYGKIVTNK